MNNMAKNLLLWLLIAAVLLSVFNNFNLRTSTEQVGYSAFISEVQSDRLSKVVVDGLTISAQRKDGSTFETVRPMVEDPKLMDDLLSHNITVEGKKPEQQSVWTQLLIASFPILLIIAVFMFFMRQMHLAHKEHEDSNDQQNRETGDEQLRPNRLLLGLFALNGYVVRQQIVHQLGVFNHRPDGLKR